MANFYLRVPHYVASYIRNKDQANPIMVSGTIYISPTDKLWNVLNSSIHFNRIDNVVRIGCFCERQWKMMMRGFPIQKGINEKASKRAVITTEDVLTLNDSEISVLAGISKCKGEDAGEYLCFSLPSEVCVNGVLYKTNTQWQPLKNGAKVMIAELTRDFWRAFFIYMDKDKDWCIANHIERTTMESIERFMTRYDIRNSSDNREKKTLKRNYYRKRKVYQFSFEDYVEHAGEKEQYRGI